MKHLSVGLLAMLGVVVASLAQAQDKPEALIYISPHEFQHEVRLGVPPYFSRWFLKGPTVVAASKHALGPQFSSLELCDGTSGADVLVWVKPSVTYNPTIRVYYAQVKVQFHLGNGKQLAVYKATGEQPGAIASVYAEQQVQQAFTVALQDIARQYEADTHAQQVLADAIGQQQTKVPCAMIGAIPNP